MIPERVSVQTVHDVISLSPGYVRHVVKQDVAQLIHLRCLFLIPKISFFWRELNNIQCLETKLAYRFKGIEER